jgi:hypothetical protein
VLIEAAWCCRFGQAVSRELTARRVPCPTEVVNIARRAQARLGRKFQRLIHRGKTTNKAVVAVARELAGFVWAIGQYFPPIEASV